MNRQLRFSPRALQDLDDIWKYIAKDSPSQADRWIEGLLKTADSLRDNSQLGRRREEWGRGLRSIVHGRYLLVYEINNEWVGLVRVLHGARDLRTALQK